MSNIHFLSSSTKTEHVACRIAVSFLLFSGVLTLALFLSQVFLLSRFTQIEIGGEVRDADQVEAYHAELLSRVASAETQRNSLVLPIQDELYQQLQYAKHTQVDYWSARERISALARQFSSDAEKSIALHSMSFSASDNSLELQGSAYHAGLRSMTVLAQFTEALRALPFSSSVPNPQFVRNKEENGSSHSPFTLRIYL